MSVLRSALRVRPAAVVRASAVRFNSTAAASSSAAGSSADTGSSSKLPMAWTEYFAMRKRRKNWSNITSVPSALAGLFLGAGYFANLDIDATQPIMGVDPM